MSSAKKDLPAFTPQLFSLSPAERSRRKRKSIIRAAEGFFLLLAVILPLSILNAVELSIDDWISAVAACTMVWSTMLLIIVTKADRFLVFFDPHFLVIPALGAALLISYFAYLMPDLRMLVLGGWFTVLLFGGGLMTFRQSLILSFAMGIGYMLAVYAIAQTGYPINLTAEVGKVIPFWVFWGYSGRVTERMRMKRLENKMLREELSQYAFTDSLTGLYNRRAFENEFEQRKGRLKANEYLGVLLFDIDYFKRVNDTKGHEAGDDLLKEFAAVLSRAFGNDACLARLGGDEFAAIIRVDSLNELEQSLEDIFHANRQAIGGLFTHSCGAVLTSSKYSTSRVLRVADTSLYEAKARGRDCFVTKDLDEVSVALATAPKIDPSLEDLDQLR